MVTSFTRRATLFAIAVPFLCAQQPAQTQKPDLVLRSTTRLVQVSVVVHDKKGEPITDLKKEDFVITEKGKPQTISVFSMEASRKIAQRAITLPPNIFSNSLLDKTGTPNAVTVILLDSLNTKWTDQAYAKRQVVKFLRQLHPEDRVAIYTLGRGLTILHDYTTDSSALLARLEKFNGDNLPNLAASEPTADEIAQNKELSLDGVFSGQAEADFYMTNRVLNTLKALEVIANHLASVPGRKNLIWVSGSFPLQIGFDDMEGGPNTRDKRTFTDETTQTVRALNQAGVAMYPVDARGLMIDANFTGADQRGSVRPGAPPPRRGPAVPHLDAMIELADRTGGRAAYNTNDLEHAIQRAMDDSRVTYTLAYYPDTNLDGKFHDIKVKVNRPGANVRYRKGYFALAATPQDEKTRKEEIRGGVWSPLDSTAVAINARVDLIDKPDPNTIHVYLQIEPANLNFTQENDRWKSKLDVAFVQKDERAHAYGNSITDTIEMALKNENYTRILKTGIIYEKSFPRDSGATNLRIVVRDVTSGSMGTLTVPYSQVKPLAELLKNQRPASPPPQKRPNPVNPPQ